ncbi:MAG: GGDEF domain-containing protein [Gammaproteobacteria bacterium]|jgi:diguanylate cyclase (GGDEF)-like protein
MSTPQLLETGRHKDSNTLNLVLRPFAELTTASNDEFSAALRLNTVLQTTLDIGALIKLFADELIILMPFDGFSYRNSARDIDITFGKAARHKCSYRLIVGEENLGEVTLSRRRKFQERETAMVEHLLVGLVCPLRNALTYLNAVRAAQKDPLTGINNRAAMDNALAREIELARRHRTPLSLIVMDIDKFKSINDTYGHTTGDEIIKTFTKVVGRIIRKTDMLFRYGGEEFVVIMSNTGRDGSMLLAERIRRGIEKMDVLLPQYHLPVTVSLGVASLKLREDGKSLFKRADQALYQAKASGRNCVCLADSTSAYS